PESGATIVSRGEFIGAMVADRLSNDAPGVEFVLARLDGTILVHHREPFPRTTFGGDAAIVAGNAGGTFVFSAPIGDTQKMWVAVFDGNMVGLIVGLRLPNGGRRSELIDPDDRGRVLVFSEYPGSNRNEWLDICAGTHTSTR